MNFLLLFLAEAVHFKIRVFAHCGSKMSSRRMREDAKTRKRLRLPSSAPCCWFRDIFQGSVKSKHRQSVHPGGPPTSQILKIAPTSRDHSEPMAILIHISAPSFNRCCHIVDGSSAILLYSNLKSNIYLRRK